MRIIIILIGVFMSSLVFAGSPLRIASSILPITGIIESIGGSYVRVTTLVKNGADPHVYEPLPSQLRELSRCQAYFSVGSGLEFELAWLDKFQALNKNMRVVNCSAGISLF
jgi:zinc transport system substrate-binding protein